MEVRESEYVTLEVHNLQLERIELLMERNLARQEAIASDIKGELRVLNAKFDSLERKLDTEVKRLDNKIDGLETTLNARIDGLETTLNARIDGLEKKFDARFEAVDAKINGLEKKVDARFDGIESAILLTNNRIDDLMSKQSNNLAKWGIIIAVVVCVVQVITSILLK